MANYFNTLNLRQQLDQLGRCRFMDRARGFAIRSRLPKR